MRGYLSSLLLGAALCAPAVMYAQDEHHDKRYYDRDKKDYHEWNEGEEHAYRHWMEAERRHAYHPWAKASREEQKEYWHWRHEHMDWH